MPINGLGNTPAPVKKDTIGSASSRTENEINKQLGLIGDASETTRNNAADAIVKLAQSNISSDLKTKIVDTLIEDLRSDDYHTRMGASNAMQQLAHSNNVSPDLKAKMVDPLIQMLGSDDTHVNCYSRYHAANALGDIAKTPGISADLKAKMADPLLQALADPNQEVQGSAAGSLANLIESNVDPQVKSTIVNSMFMAMGSSQISQGIISGTLESLATSTSPNMTEGLKKTISSRLNGA
jgi:hypothetical protein